MAELRLQRPGGRLSVQNLRDLVGWMGAAGARTLRFGDAQDVIIEAAGDPGPAPVGWRRGEAGSIQSSAFGPAPAAAAPWLTTGVWLDLLDALPDPGPLDVQLIHAPALGHFPRHGHLRFVAGRAAHQWSLSLRRPGSDRVVTSRVLSSGELSDEVLRAVGAWHGHEESFWQGESASPAVVSAIPEEQGWRTDAGGTSFGYAPASRLSVERLRDLTWLAAESGPPRITLTPARVLLFEGLSTSSLPRWEEWLVQQRVPARRGDLEAAVVAAGRRVEALAARDEVVALLRSLDRMPPGRRLVVADDALNRGDGVAVLPFPLLIRTATGWLSRSGDGTRADEGTLEEVLAQLESPTRGASMPSPAERGEPSRPPRCGDCLTVYDPLYGDPRGGILPGVSFAQVPDTWVCPVCAAPKESWST